MSIRDLAIVGAGIVGAATAARLSALYPKLSIVLLDKEPRPAFHQTGRNSCVIHSGIYYKPGSLKAQLCTSGNAALYQYCEQRNIPTQRCGKLIIALDAQEEHRLRDIYKRGEKNGVPDIKWVEKENIKDYEPHALGQAAIHCPSTGIVEYQRVTEALVEDLEAHGGTFRPNCLVKSMTLEQDVVTLQTEDGNDIAARHVITCAGNHADRLYRMTNSTDNTIQTVPFRGEYLELKPHKRYLVRGNIYPVPNPALPFLGFHFTPRMDGSLWLGPNAVPAFAREGYTYSDISMRDMAEMLTFPGYLKLAAKHARFGMRELYRSFNPDAQIRQLQRYIPDLQTCDVTPVSAGVRAQALDINGELVDDFVIRTKGRVMHVLNAPSPAATSALAIADMIAARVSKEFVLAVNSRH